MSMLILMVCSIGVSHAQPSISGIVNDYVQVKEVFPCDSTIRVESAQGLSAGSRVLLTQMKGALASIVNDSTYGTILAINGAGATEFLTIDRIDGDLVTFTTRMVHDYSPSGMVQLVRVPVYDDVIVGGPLSAKPWNGTTGGVLAIEVRGALAFAADITVDGAGFRGGRTSIPRSRCDVGDYVANWALGLSAEKGEGVFQPATNAGAGRGPAISGGGGGNGNNAGGGGGGNAGRGGVGGNPNLYCHLFPAVGGYGGNALDTLNGKQRFFLGGGGGGGHQNDVQGTGGAAGGGLVVIKAKRIVGNGHTISANGSNVTLLAGEDGCGGGGAGGTVVIDADTVEGSLTVSCAGGAGGSTNAMYNAHGPGGGGAGGAVVLTRLHASLTMDLRGGGPGTHLVQSNEVYKSSFNAEPGGQGTVTVPFVWKRPISISLTVGGDAALCEGTVASIDASPGFASYRWSDGSTSPRRFVSDPGSYVMVAVDSGGCTHVSRSVVVSRNTTSYSVGGLLDFGTCDFNVPYRKTHAFRNTDDEALTIGSIEMPNGFRLLRPAFLPVVVPAGQQLDLEVEFIAAEDRPYSGSMVIIATAPCADTGVVECRATVNPVYVTFSVPDTVAGVGVRGFGIPLYSVVEPDTTSLKVEAANVILSFDNRVFTVDTIFGADRMTDVVDLVNNVRTITLRIAGVNVRGGAHVVATLVGTTLSSVVKTTPIRIVGVTWVAADQEPVTKVKDGSLRVDPLCYGDARVVRFFAPPLLQIAPNPAVDDIAITVGMTVPGAYELTIVDVQGNSVMVRSFDRPFHDGQGVASRYVNETLRIPSGSLANGAYVARLITPVQTLSVPFVVAR